MNESIESKDMSAGRQHRTKEPPVADRVLAEQLVERARVEGVELVGPGGLLAGLTKQVLETSLKIEMGCAVRLMLDV